MNFREAKADDIPQISKAFTEVFNHSPWNESWNEETSKQKILEVFGSMNFVGFVGEENKTITSFALGNYEIFNNEISYYLKELAVIPLLQRQGIASNLLKELELFLVKSNIDSIFLITDMESTAEAFYTSLNYISSKRAVVMKKRLSTSA